MRSKTKLSEAPNFTELSAAIVEDASHLVSRTLSFAKLTQPRDLTTILHRFDHHPVLRPSLYVRLSSTANSYQ